MRTLAAIIVFSFLSLSISANTFTVTNTNDAGAGSLREALTNAQYYPGGPHSLAFNIPTSDAGYDSGKGVWTIVLQTALPYITKDNLIIDGTTQTTNQGNTNLNGPEIIIDGNNRTVDFGFYIFNATAVVVKGFGIQKFLYGVQLMGTDVSGCTVSGCYVGVNYNATDSASCYIGIVIMGGHDNVIGGDSPDERNVVSGNGHIGIRVASGNYNIITGNYVGTDRTGTYAIPNYDGISIEGAAAHNRVGGYTVSERNLVSGNVAYGIPVFGAGCDYNLIVGNYVGTDVTGSFAIPNTYGLLFDDGAANNLVGGSGPAARNLFSGNSAYGIFLYNLGTRDNVVKGNFIGTDASGMLAVPNANGITVDGAPVAHLIDSNVISGNIQQGIVLHITYTDSTVITRNLIGLAVDGQTPLGNGMDGIRIGEGPKYTQIGGDPTMGNKIAYNGGNGVTVMTSADINNSIRGNSIFGNLGLGIDLYPPGSTANDAGDVDSGPNQGMNFPDILTNVQSGTDWSITGHLDHPAPTGCIIELFGTDFGSSQGRYFVGYCVPLANGNFSLTLFNFMYGALTATATDAAGNTSEFSPGVTMEISLPASVQKGEYTISPNPATDWIHFSLPEEGHKSVFCKIFSIDGKLMMESEIAFSAFTIYTGNLSAGLYQVVIFEDGIAKDFKKISIIRD
jgi:hypothetical protein